MRCTRRDVLKIAAGLAVGCLLGAPLAVYARRSGFSGQKLVVGSGEVVEIIDLGTMQVSKIPVGFVPHSFVQHPLRPERVWAIERGVYADRLYFPGAQRGPSAAELDLHEGRVVQSVKLSRPSEFFGHGFFTPDATALFISRVDMEEGTGHLTGYDAADCRKMVADYLVAPGALHESRLMPDGTALVVNSGIRPVVGPRPLMGPRVAKGALTHYDIVAGRALRTWPVEDDNQMAGHGFALKDGTLLVVSRPRGGVEAPGKVHIGKWEGTSLQEVAFDGTIRGGVPGECLSLAVNETTQRAVITNPENHRILVLDTQKGIFVDEIPMMAKGMVFDEKDRRFIGSGDALCLLNAEGHSIDGKQGIAIDNSYGSCSAHSLLI